MLKLKRILENTPIGLSGYAKLLGVADKTLYNKLTGASEFNLGEFRRLKALLPEYDILYLMSEEAAPGQDSA